MARPAPEADRLLSPLDLGARRARNRIFFGPHETNLGRRRSISDRHVAYYARRAAGGTGVIVVEEASVHPSDWPYERCPLAADCAEGWGAVGRACHDEGALVLAALGHSGGQGSSAYSQAPLLAPSRVPEVNSREVPKWMEPSDIAAVVASFGSAAASAVAAGLDGVEVNAGQHSLVRQFLSGLTNQREDEWGADRSLFARQVLGAVRAGAGAGAVVGLRLSCDELAPWAGIVPEAAASLAAELAEWVDYLTVVRGSIFSVAATRPDTHVEPGFNLGLVPALRAALPERVRLVAQGSLVDRALAHAALDAGADAVEMTRAQIAEPLLVATLASGGAPRPCILCNQACQVRDARNPIVSCVGEPRSGHETTDPDPVRPAATVRHVLVVGGGPAGLECARVAAGAGHRVSLVEARPWLGGMLRVAAAGAGRGRLAALADWLEEECRRLGVDITLGTSVAAARLRSHSGPVVLATGGRPGTPTYSRGRGARVVTAAELLAARLPGTRLSGAGAAAAPLLPDGPVAVWDPIGGPIGISVAELLAAEGRPVHLVTPDLIPGNELARSGDLAPANTRLQALGVVLEKRSLLRSVAAGRVRVEDRFTGQGRVIEVGAVVDAGYRLPDDRLWKQAGGRHQRVGDAVSPRSVYEAVLEGRRAALAVDGGAAPAPAPVPGMVPA